jgi:hypothetical protein
MRLPKTVRINNIPFKVVKDRKSMRSGFSYNKATITIGTKTMADCEVLENFIHEVAEISSVERGLRSSRCKPQDSPEYVFCGNHSKFTALITDVSIVVADMMRLK